MNIGKEIRLSKFIQNNKTLIMPLDHGVEGVFSKLGRMNNFVSELSEKSDAFVLRRGAIKNTYKQLINRASIILRVTCATTVEKQESPTYENFVASIEEALRLGADAVMATVWFGSVHENNSIKDFGKLAELCERYGMPLIGEPLICQDSGLDPKDEMANIIAARTLSEEGADIIKVIYTGTYDSFRNVVNYCLVPVITAGGDRSGSEIEFLTDVENMIKAGAIGTSIGRNIWNRDKHLQVLNAVDGIIKKGMTAHEAFNIFLK